VGALPVTVAVIVIGSPVATGFTDADITTVVIACASTGGVRASKHASARKTAATTRL
jgi:hypothetical protein